MLKDILLDTLYTTTHTLSETLLSKVYHFHDIRVTCQTNHAAILAILDTLLGIFPEPDTIQDEVTYLVLCYDSVEQFPVKLPAKRVRTETMRLLTNTRLKCYRSTEDTIQYQSFVALPPVNAAVLSVIHPAQSIALTQLEMPDHYQAAFLRRYVLLLALGQLMQQYGFEPCHAGAVTAPWKSEQGALILGASGSGKTTLSIGCTMLGCGLLGDDLVMLRGNTVDRSIRAYALSHEISIRSGSLDLWPTLSFLRGLPVDLRDKRHCTIEQIQPGAGRISTLIRLLLFPSLSMDTQSTVTPLSKARTLQALVDECLGKKNISQQAQERLFLLLSSLADQAAGYRLAIARSASDGPEVVRSLLAGHGL